MSYRNKRTFNEGDDLYRVRIWTGSHWQEVYDYKTKTYSDVLIAPESKFVGPYTNIGTARGMATRERKWVPYPFPTRDGRVFQAPDRKVTVERAVMTWEEVDG